MLWNTFAVLICFSFELLDPDDLYTLSGESRQVGTVICRGPNILTVNPIEGMVEIQNPYE